MGGAGFEPAKATPSDLQSDPFDRSGNPPGLCQARCKSTVIASLASAFLSQLVASWNTAQISWIAV